MKKIFVIVLVVAFGLILYLRQSSVRQIINFEGCAKAGYKILQTDPEQCQTPDGRIFVKPSEPLDKPPSVNY